MTGNKIKTGIVVVIVVASITTLWMIHRRSEDKLRGELQSLQEKLESLDQLTAENERLSNLVAQSKSSVSDNRMRELLKLRAEVGSLNRQLAEKAKVQAQATARVAQADQPADALEQQKRMAIDKMADAKRYVLGFRMFADDNQGAFPTNFDQVSAYFRDSSSAPSGTNDFEIVYRGSLDGLTNAGSVILVREWLAWRTADGKWAKVYGFADGHSEVHTDREGNFAAYEEQHGVLPQAGDK